MSRAVDLRSDYDLLGELLPDAEGAAAAAIVRERRLIGELLEALESTEVVSVVDQLASRRRTKAGDPDSASSRRKPG